MRNHILFYSPWENAWTSACPAYPINLRQPGTTPTRQHPTSPVPSWRGSTTPSSTSPSTTGSWLATGRWAGPATTQLQDERLLSIRLEGNLSPTGFNLTKLFFFMKWTFFNVFAIKRGLFIVIALVPYVTKWESLTKKLEKWISIGLTLGYNPTKFITIVISFNYYRHAVN